MPCPYSLDQEPLTNMSEPVPPPPSRALAVDGLVNVRDLGGLRRSGGGVTPQKVFYRAENLDWVTAKGWEQLAAEGIRTVVDLRQPGERLEDRNPRPGWLTTRAVDLDGLDNRDFWKDYADNGLIGTALYFLPHLRAMPERAGSALSAILTAPPGGVLFHCMGGRDRTGMISMLLLVAIGTEVEEIVDDYLETVRLGDVRASARHRRSMEPELEARCQEFGTTTEGAFRAALDGLDLAGLLDAAGLSTTERRALATWRGSATSDPSW